MSKVKRDSFASHCLRLKTFVEIYSLTYSDKECVSVFLELMIKITMKQENPEQSLKQLISVMEKRVNEEMGNKK